MLFANIFQCKIVSFVTSVENFMYLTRLSVFTAGQEKENQERNKDPGKSKGWPKYHLTVRYRQGSCGNFDFLF